MSGNPVKNFAYTVLNWLTFGKGVGRTINGMKVRFPAKWSRYYESNYEESNYNFLKQEVKPGMHIVDIGAHMGLFSVVCSQLTGVEGKVISFEPTPDTFSILKNTLKLNHCNNVTPVQAAVSNKEGKATFYVGNTPADNSNSLVQNRPAKDLSGYDVRLVTIDSAVKEYALHPKLIKIDAEGAELDVLKGGTTSFQKYKPLLILGLHPDFIQKKGDSLEAIWDLLVSMNYEISMDDKKLSKEDFCSNELLFDVHCR